MELDLRAYLGRYPLVNSPGGNMQLAHRRAFIVAATSFLILSGCSLPARTPTPTADAGAYAATIAALQTRAVGTATAQGFGSALTPAPPTLPAFQTTLTSQFPVVTIDTQCWRGPGAQYEVIGTIGHGTEVPLLGRGVISGWFILRNPTYGDPCWLQGSALQFPPGYDISALPIFNPPATATITPLPTSATPGTPGPSPTP